MTSPPTSVGTTGVRSVTKINQCSYLQRFLELDIRIKKPNDLPPWIFRALAQPEYLSSIQGTTSAGLVPRLRDEHGIAMPDNPARWDDLKAMGYEAPAQLSRGRHPSLAYQQMPAFMAALRERDAIAARMLEFLILTNVRTGAALAATWDEFDLDAFVWTVPLVNLKDKKHRKQAFRVPLSARAVEILREMQSARVSRHVFPGFHGKALSNMAMLTLLKRMNRGDQKWLDALSGKPIVPHGFRASFRTWAEEIAHFPHAVIEEAMGHIVGTQVERAYRRTDVLEQRRQLMDAWASHCEPGEPGKVIKFEKPGGRSA
jgi:integrase